MKILLTIWVHHLQVVALCCLVDMDILSYALSFIYWCSGAFLLNVSSVVCIGTAVSTPEVGLSYESVVCGLCDDESVDSCFDIYKNKNECCTKQKRCFLLYTNASMALPKSTIAIVST